VLHSPIKYKPFDDLLRARECDSDSKYWNALRTVHTVVFTGGRDSGKSHVVSRSLCDAATNYNHRILYTRYTLTSAQDSIIPDFIEKMSMLNYEQYFHVTKDRIIGNHNDSKIVFKGIKTSSGMQTANLKSLKDFSMFVVEEAEEFPSYDEWDKIQLSIRATDVQALNVLVLNPTTKKHWIYTEFFKRNGVKEGFNGIRNGIMFIHTTYLDLGKRYIAPKNWNKYEAARIVYERIERLSKEERKVQSKNDIRTWKYYKFTVLGGWKDSEEGLVYPDYELFKEFPKDYRIRIYGLDFGFSNDPLGFVECVIVGENDLYLKQHIYKTGLLNRDTIPMIKSIVKDLANTYIVADCSDPKEIAEFRAEGIALIPADKTYKGNGASKMRGIRQMQNFNIHVHEDSQDLIDEMNHYHFIEIVNAKGETVTHVVDKDDHLLDPAMYAATRY
jgi:phage terminase large subunit